MTRVLVCGGRSYGGWKFLSRELDRLNEEMSFSLIIHGGAPGADSLADSWANLRKIPRMVFKANWAKYGRAAGANRNRKMLVEGRPELVVAVPGGPGTAHMVEIAKKAGVRVVEFAE